MIITILANYLVIVKKGNKKSLVSLKLKMKKNKMRLILNGGINNALAFKVQVAKLTNDN